MNTVEQISIVAAIAGFAWLGFQKYSNTKPSAVATSDHLPWYLQYNNTPPVPTYYGDNSGTISTPAQSIPYNASSIQNNDSPPCATCSMFGAGWGGQY